MPFTTRANMAAGVVYTAADQNASKGNDDFLFGQVLGPLPPAATGGMVRQWVQKTGMADDVATEVFTITTTNEAGDNDGGAYLCMFRGIAVHGGNAAGKGAIAGLVDVFFVRVMNADGAGVNSAVAAGTVGTTANEAGGFKTISTASAMTVVETSEYVQSVLWDINVGGTDITTGEVYGMVELYYKGFTTAPVITSAG